MNKAKFNLIGHKTYTTRFKDPGNHGNQTWIFNVHHFGIVNSMNLRLTIVFIIF